MASISLTGRPRPGGFQVTSFRLSLEVDGPPRDEWLTIARKP